jgi:hypothetical protein
MELLISFFFLINLKSQGAWRDIDCLCCIYKRAVEFADK